MKRALFLTAAVSLFACSPAPAQQANAGDTVARMGDRVITAKELDDKWKALDPAGHAEAAQKLYDGKRSALDAIVAESLIAQAAKAKNMSAEDYEAAELKTRMKPVGEADGNVEMPGDFRERPALQPMHFKGQPGPRRQFTERRHQPAQLIAVQRRLFRRRHRRGQAVKLIGRRRVAFQGAVPRPVQRQVAHDAIEIAGGVADLLQGGAVLIGPPLIRPPLIRPPLIRPPLIRLGKAQIGLLHHILGARPAADDRLGIVDQRAAMGEIEVKRELVVGQSRAYLERVAASTYLMQAGSRRAERRSPYRRVSRIAMSGIAMLKAGRHFRPPATRRCRTGIRRRRQSVHAPPGWR